MIQSWPSSFKVFLESRAVFVEHPRGGRRGGHPASLCCPRALRACGEPGREAGKVDGNVGGCQGTGTASGGGFTEERLRLGFPGISRHKALRGWSLLQTEQHGAKARRGV